MKLTHNVPYGRWNLGLTAIDTYGKEHAPGSWGGRGSNDLSYDAAVYADLRLSAIEEFRFQVRPYHWVEFENVSLQPGQKTYVNVIAPEPSVSKE